MLYARVYGVPAPQGSKSFKGMFKSKKTGRMVPKLAESSAKVAPWRTAVTLAMIAAQEATPVSFDGAVRLTLQFVMPRVQSEPKGWTRHHTKAPDLSKLIRCTEDAITDAGSIWVDDSRVVEVTAVKVTAEPGEAPGCCIVIEALPEKEKPHGTAKTGSRSGTGKAAGRGTGSKPGRGRKQPAGTADGALYFA